MKFRDFIPAVKAVLGIDNFQEVDGRQVLTSEDRATLAASGFPEQFAADFENALNEKAAAKAEPANARVAALSAVLGQVTSQLTAANAELEQLKAQAGTATETISAKETKIKELEQRVSALAAMPEPDNAQVIKGNAKGINLADTAQLGGFQGAMFALDRPYNQRARAALYAAQGLSVPVAAASSVDYSTLKEDLGAYYRTPWRDRLQSFLSLLPSIETIFPLESGYQDLATLVNVFLGEFSQPDNTIGSNFDNVTKGSYEFGTETLRMYSVMFAHKFQNLAQLEKSWIGSLNREGSDPVKMSFIEYLLAETAKKLQNEREMRRVNGVRKDPNPNVPGRAMDAADGLYEFIRKKVDGHIDYTPDGGTTGRTVYQIKPFNLPKITPANIGEVLYQGTSMIPSHLRDAGNIVCYIPSHLIPVYHKYNEAKYGTNQDYQAGLMCVKEFPNVKLVPVPNAGNHFRIIWTIEGNIKCYEHLAGEMLNFRLEQQDWSVKVWSNWKESIWAESVGYKFTNPAEMDGSQQLIWCNDYDFADDFFLPSTPDANPSVLRHTSVVTVANKQQLEITDIADAKAGAIISVKCGATGEEGVTIKKAGKFELISADWTPALGDTIRLMKRADGKFIELNRTTAASGGFMFDADETAPDVSDADTFVTGNNTEATEITDLQGASLGVVYTIYGNGTKNASVIKNGGKFVLTTTSFALTGGAMIQLTKAADGKFYEVARVAGA